MVDETIHIKIEDAELEDAISKADDALSRSTQVKDSGWVNMGWNVNRLKTDVHELEKSGLSLKDLPNVDREMRIIITKIPEMREALGLYYRAKMLLRGAPEIGIMVIAAWLFSEAARVIEEVKEQGRRQDKEFEAAIREFQHLRTHGEYTSYIEAQDAKENAFRSQPT